jgi:hypothetical protein
MKMRRISALMAVAALGLALSVAQAEDTPDATLKLSKGSVAAGIGFSWGSGTLTYQGKDYPITVNGLSVGDVGVSRIEASGKVYNLKKLADFDGNYTAATAGATIAGGASATAMKNQNGVSVHLVSTSQGLKWNLSASGVSMRISQ